jgi:hypothetical protein
MEFISILSNKGDCWNADAVSRSSGCLVNSCLNVSALNIDLKEITLQVCGYPNGRY